MLSPKHRASVRRRPTATGANPHRGDIQGMRAVAVLLVVAAHSGLDMWVGGFIGVDVFFVISGFLITGILVREVRRTGRVSIADFYARRARRILPAASVTLLAIVLVSTQVFNYVRIDDVLSHVTWAAFFSANIFSALSGSDYFAADTSFVSPVQHFWSLAVEEQFYLVWPPLIALALWSWRRRRNKDAEAPDPILIERKLRRVAVMISVLCIASLAWSIWRTEVEPNMAYFSTLTRGWELGLGALLALCTTWVGRWPAALKFCCSWIGLAMIGYAALTYTPATPFPSYWAAIPVVGTAMVLAGGIEGPRYGAALVLDRGLMRWFGDISYSLYLWHWPFLTMPAVYLERDLRLRERAVLVLAAIVVSWISYKFVETPVRRAKGLSRSRVKALVMWPAAVAVVMAAVLVVQAQFGREAVASAPYVRPKVDPEPQTVQQSKDPVINEVGFAAELARAEYKLPRGLQPFPGELKADNWRLPKKCWAETADTKHDICPMGDVNGKRTVVMFGDSHVGMWVEPMLKTAEARGWKVLPFIKTGCFPGDVTMWRTDRLDPYTECDDYRKWAYDEIRKVQPDRIVTTGWVNQAFTDPDTGTRIPVKDSRAVFDGAVQRTLGTLTDLAPQVYVLGGITNLPKEPEDCLATRKATMGSCALPPDDLTEERNQDWQRAAKTAGARWVDVQPWFCDDKVCPIVVRNTVVYSDTHHITRTYARTLSKGLASVLDL
jgi:peptidoglycan/LPS O-acetylase OafA/YrhL